MKIVIDTFSLGSDFDSHKAVLTGINLTLKNIDLDMAQTEAYLFKLKENKQILLYSKEQIENLMLKQQATYLETLAKATK